MAHFQALEAEVDLRMCGDARINDVCSSHLEFANFLRRWKLGSHGCRMPLPLFSVTAVKISWYSELHHFTGKLTVR